MPPPQRPFFSFSIPNVNNLSTDDERDAAFDEISNRLTDLDPIINQLLKDSQDYSERFDHDDPTPHTIARTDTIIDRLTQITDIFESATSAATTAQPARSEQILTRRREAVTLFRDASRTLSNARDNWDARRQFEQQTQQQAQPQQTPTPHLPQMPPLHPAPHVVPATPTRDPAAAQLQPQVPQPQPMQQQHPNLHPLPQNMQQGHQQQPQQFFQQQHPAPPPNYNMHYMNMQPMANMQTFNPNAAIKPPLLTESMKMEEYEIWSESLLSFFDSGNLRAAPLGMQYTYLIHRPHQYHQSQH